jgi:hypothetical protein
MFGFPALLAAGKLVACVYDTGLGLRLPPEQTTELRGRSSRTFEPYGRTMRAWTFLEPVAPEKLRVETAVLDAAIDRAEQEIWLAPSAPCQRARSRVRTDPVAHATANVRMIVARVGARCEDQLVRSAASRSDSCARPSLRTRPCATSLAPVTALLAP